MNGQTAISTPLVSPISESVIDPIQRGSSCPRCEEGTLDYNGLLELECSTCAYVLHNGGGCT